MQFSIVVAADRNQGIGKQGGLPWRLREDMAYFKRITSEVKNPAKKNAVIMGRKTWESIPQKFRPLPGRLNIVLSREAQPSLPSGVLHAQSLEAALSLCEKEAVEQAFVIGGGAVYTEALQHRACKRIYLTRVLSEFECDTFLPALPEHFEHLASNDSPVHTEDGIAFVFKVFANKHLNV